MMSERISLIIPAYNEELFIGDCLAHALEHAGKNLHEIIVVDNASTDRTAEIARSFPGVRVVREERKGLTRARQKGLESATGDILAYIDADSKLYREWYDIIRKTFDKNPSVVALSGPARYWDGTPFQKMVLSLSWSLIPIASITFGYLLYGANFAARKNALTKIEGFDGNIEFYGEDTDLGRRLSKVGEVIFKPDFYIYTSARRFTQEGIFKTQWVYLLNFLWPALFKRPYTNSHKDIRPGTI